MSSWSNEEILHFLKLYQAESLIWNPQDPEHKDKTKVANAWSRISQVLNKPVKELKKKKEILMVTFRNLLKKKQDSIRLGTVVYEPNWFAYQTMESFLLPVYSQKFSFNTDMQSYNEEGMEVVIEETSDTETARTDVSNTPAHRKGHRRRPILTEQERTERQMLKTLKTITEDLHNKKDDECDLFAKLVAIKLREFPSDQRWRIMYEIDGLFISLLDETQISQEI